MPVISLILTLLTLLPAPATTGDYAALERQAEASYSEKSFARSHDLYAQAAKLALSPEQKRWVSMRLADGGWRAEIISAEDARTALDSLIRDTGADHDRVWAEANESIGDSHWTNPHERNFGAALPAYNAALDWWAGSGDLVLARSRYLDIVFRMTEGGGQWYGDAVPNIGAIPTDVLTNAVAIAESAADRQHTRVLLAEHLLAEYRPESVERALELLDQAIAIGKVSPWYAGALFAAASRLASPGAVIVGDNGETTYKPDYVKALELYRRIENEFAPGETRFYDRAKSAIDSIVGPSVDVVIAGTFLPRSEQEVIVSWRNVPEVELTITPVDLVRDLVPAKMNEKPFADLIDVAGRSPVRRLTWETNDSGDHLPGSHPIRLTPKLDAGAYIAIVSAQGKSARQLLLVTDANIVMHHARGRSDLFVCDAVSGAPIAGARIRVWQESRPDRAFSVQDTASDKDGMATVSLESGNSTLTLAAASAPNNRQAYVQSWSYGDASPAEEWRIYAFTDRPAYRPDETVHWKFIARAKRDNRWTTPAGDAISWEIVGPRGEKAGAGDATLNAFGSFWSDLALTSTMPLGVYTINFRQSGGKRLFIGQASLFRLEEYKLPEFRVDVKTPEEKGRKKQYRLGETVEATIEATYYFGGPVADANVQVVVYAEPLVHSWAPWRKYPWYFENVGYRAPQREVKNETLKTDAQGRASVRLETSVDDGDTTFRIEARVTDASRREVDGEGTVRVTKQRYSVIAHADHFLLRPGEKAGVDFKALDANDQPVQTTGSVTVVRNRWEEIWIDSSGHDVTRSDLQRARATAVVFPPPNWRQRFAGYREEEVVKTTVTTNAEGEGRLTFDASRAGYYAIRWKSEDRDPGRPARARDVVAAETAVWVSDITSTDLGYHAGGLDIILDKESFRSGQTAAAMIVTPASGRWVLLTSSAGGILETRLLHLDGTVKLVQLPIDDRNVPSFSLTASSVFDATLATVTKMIVVPPVEHFINVDVKPDRTEYEPRQTGSVTITTRDVDGKPVAAEVALSVSDEAVTAIQSDLAGDPRQFFFGQLRYSTLQPAASVQQQHYVVLVEEKGALIDERTLPESRDERKDELDKVQAAGGVAGNVPVEAPSAQVAREAITVTAAAPPVAKSIAQNYNASTPGAVVVRSDFRSTAFWQPDVITGANGTAHVALKYPETLTTWRATARAVSAATQVGMGSASARTSLPLIVRLQAPRFFVAGDRATLSAVINNNTDAPMHVAPSIDVDGLTRVSPANAAAVDVPPHGESRTDWVVIAEHTGTAKVRVTGRSIDRGDAMEKSFTVYEHGVDKLVARSGKMRGDEAIVRLDLPPDRRATALTVRITPSIAATMLDALPYLIDYPYGCTEQTMSRFLPAAIVARTLTANGFSAADIEGHIFGGIEREHAAATHPKGPNDLGQLSKMTAASMARLYDFQHADGGWGWWKEGDSDDFMTAYVVWGFSVAKSGGLAVNDNAIRRAVAFLDRRLVQSENAWGQQSWMLHALAAWRAAGGGGAISADERRAFDNVWSHRDRLTAYSRALLALAAHDFGDAGRASTLARNLEDGAKIDRAPDQSVLVRGSGSGAAETMATAHWGEDRFWWRWYDGPVESTAFTLQALVRIDPHNALIEPAMNWLVKNRRGAQWNNTRDTAIAILALTDYLGVSGELKGSAGYELSVNGAAAGSQPAGGSFIGRTFIIDPSSVRDHNQIRIRRTGGDSPLYFSAEARFVSLEEPVKAAGNEIFVRREYFRLAPHPTLLKGVAYDREPLRDGGAMNSGERVEVVATIETKNDYDYLLLEDLKPAGLEAVSLQSGEPLYAREVHGNRAAWVYQELRDRKVAMFIDHLPQGMWEIRYTLRAEVPGQFHALPLLGQAMYVPEIRANGDEVRITVGEAE